MSSKHFANEPLALVQAGLQALTRINPSVGYNEAQKTVFLKSATATPNVVVISGGGSGHEPSFAGFVGEAFLSGAVAGSIFASPSADQVYRCLLHLGSQRRDKGILVVIMNYTGDKLHFGMAVEKARAAGIQCELLVVSDDVGVGRARSGRIGRRGLAGTVLVQKIAGALAAKGVSLDDVYKTCSLVVDNVVTVGASLAHVHVPGRAASQDELDLNEEIEIGMGIHNEEGFGRVKATLPELVSTMLKQLLDQADKDRAFINLQSTDDVALMVNNLGGISQLELGAITNEVCSQLATSYKISPKRVLAGTYMSSLNGMGFSITLLKAVDPVWLELIDAPVEASGWVPAIVPKGSASQDETNQGEEVVEEESQPSNLRVDPAATQKALTSALQSAIAAEPEITKYDTLVGDGDCGLCLKTCAEAVLAYLASQSQDPAAADAVRFVESLARVVEHNMDGTSGALYAIFLNALAHGLRKQDGGEVRPATPAVWAAALQDSMTALGRYTPAQPGDRTVVDALAPFVETFAKTGGDLAVAVDAARKGCESTKGMEASLGRSVYVGGETWKECPDPGAYGLVKLLEGLANGQ